MAKCFPELLQTDGVKARMHVISDETILAVEEDGRMLDVRDRTLGSRNCNKLYQVKDFALAQPEVKKMRWKDHDYLPGKNKLDSLKDLEL